ncbi:alpha/beta hydrolase [Amycolatopsis sp. SID8362]|uniref:serine aminopeptidase domain-containing protein n=1 Tax=Amycolatopsis sp. SID8362 TaxID=2690346 RepID=UPI001EF37F75|nr:alpha/beta hydrolase [Amycolatopsis sp. SID8362]
MDTGTPAEPKGLVVFFHGLGEHIGSYEPLAEALAAAGSRSGPPATPGTAGRSRSPRERRSCRR